MEYLPDLAKAGGVQCNNFNLELWRSGLADFVTALPQQDLQESDIVALAPIAEDVAEAGSDSDTLGWTIPPL